MCRCLANSLESFSDLADTFSNSNDHDNRGTYIYLLHGVKKINLKIIDDGEDFESSFENVDEKIIM